MSLCRERVVGGFFGLEHGAFYDTVLIFGGPGNGANGVFMSLSATIGLFYANGQSNSSPFTSYFSFGGDTGETTHDVHVAYAGGGVDTVAAGSPN